MEGAGPRGGVGGVTTARGGTGRTRGMSLSSLTVQSVLRRDGKRTLASGAVRVSERECLGLRVALQEICRSLSAQVS